MYPANSTKRFSWLTCSTPIFIVGERSNIYMIILVVFMHCFYYDSVAFYVMLFHFFVRVLWMHIHMEIGFFTYIFM